MLLKAISTRGVENDVRGVLRQSLAEASGGFAAGRFPDREAAGELIYQIDAGKEHFSRTDLDLLVRSLEFSLKELGEEEFQTITGHDFSFGVSTLAELKNVAKEQG
jgi:hypothetical protein